MRDYVEPYAVNRLCLSMRNVRDYHPLKDYRQKGRGRGHLKHDFRLTERIPTRPEVFNRGSATPRGSAEVLQGVRQIISSEAFFPSSKNVKRPIGYININRT